MNIESPGSAGRPDGPRAVGARPGRGAPRRPRGLASRRAWHRMSAVLVRIWACVVIAGMVGRHRYPGLGWVGLHAAALGVATNAVVVWSDYFAAALMRSPSNRRAPQIAILSALNVGILALLGGTELGAEPAQSIGTLLCVLAILGHVVNLGVRSAEALTTRLGRTVLGYYIACGCWFVVCSLFGHLMTAAGGSRLDVFMMPHIATGVLGWLGLAVMGTLLTLWPTMLRTRMVPGAETNARRVLPLFCIAIAATGLGGVAAHGWISALGLFGYTACVGVTVNAMWAASKVKRPVSYASRSVICGMTWLVGALVVAIVLMATSADRQQMLARLPHLAWPFLGGFATQLIVGSLSYLLPVVIGGGPGRVRRRNAIMDTLGDARLVSANASGLSLLAPLPQAARVAALVVLAANVLFFFVTIARCVLAEKPLPISADGTMSERGRRLTWVLGAGVVALAMSVATAVSPATVIGVIGSGAGTGADISDAPVQRVSVTGADMRFTPNRISIAAGTHLIVTLTNEDTGGQVHDLTFASGAGTGLLPPGASAEVDAGVIGESQEAWCSVAGHRQMGMVLQVVVDGTAAPAGPGSSGSSGDHATLDPNATMSVGPFDASLAPAPDGTVHDVHLEVTEEVVEVAPGVRQLRYRYNGQSPGPILHGRVGDTFVVTLTNSGSMGHSIDFHAGDVSPDDPMRTIPPGQTLTYTFKADRSGIWLYHCSTSPMSLHLANGMFGAVVIDPEGLPEVDEEYVVVESESWFGPQGSGEDADRLGETEPDAVMFNGYAFQYDDYPLEAEAGDRVRFWALDAGPNEQLNFHIVGAQFDTVWKEGAYALECGYQPSATVDASCGTTGTGGSQALSLGAAEGGFVELVVNEPGHYKFVNHSFSYAEKGAHGILEVTGR
ncbi:multicopper oxidase domain-containing protein [uncultured Propionibacterium sp.]|uniref:multicopper oxidase domain-containing protein n=1 Tax=uncultured Propionibacterium sp. TaxID=218066 RepID=UPI00292D6B37|nr:multicopper oxidase domain-containing protein [uncultured Propionibacterium sp.]